MTETVDAGGGGGTVVTPDPAAVVTPAATTPDPWAEYVSKAEPGKLEPYKNAKSPIEAFELAQSRLAEAQTALRTRQPGLPPRPPADAAPEAHAAWRAAAGLPETPDGYGLTKPEGLPDTLWDPEEATSFAKFAHEQGMRPDDVKALQSWYAQVTQDKMAAMQQEQAKQAEHLRVIEAQELGKRFGAQLDPMLADVQAVTQAMGKDPAIFDPASDKFWGVEALQFAVDMMKRIPRGEDGSVRSMGAPSQSGHYDKAWAKASMVQGHPDYDARTNTKHPRHAEINRLANEAYALG